MSLHLCTCVPCCTYVHDTHMYAYYVLYICMHTYIVYTYSTVFAGSLHCIVYVGSTEVRTVQ